MTETAFLCCKETGLRLTVFIAIAEEACDPWLVDRLLAIKDRFHREWKGEPGSGSGFGGRLPDRDLDQVEQGRAAAARGVQS